MHNCFIKQIITKKQENQIRKIQHNLKPPFLGLIPQSEKDNDRKKEIPQEWIDEKEKESFFDFSK